MTPPAPGSTWRWVVIHGDASAIGLIACLGGAGLSVAAFAAGWPLGWAALGLALASGGTALVAWTRRAWLALLDDVRARHAGDDPGDSPVPWVADRVWREANGFDPVLDAPMVLRAEVQPSLRVYPHDEGPAVVDPVLRPVSDAERELQPAQPIAEGTPPPSADADGLRASLVGTPGRFVVLGPRWPVCCGRLSTLTARTPRADERAITLPAQGMADGDPHTPPGLHTYACPACGRVWRTHPTWSGD